MSPKNRQDVAFFCANFKEMYPNKTIWCYTGHLFEEVKDYIDDIDVLIDGKFIEEKKIINGKEGKSKEKWPNILNNLKESGKILLYTNLINATPVELNDLVIGIEFKNGVTPFIKSIIEKPENMAELEKTVSIEYGKEMKIKIIDGKTEKVNKVPDNPMANLPTDLDIPINIIEE